MEKIEDYILDNNQLVSVPRKHHYQVLKDEDLEDIIEPKIGVWHWFKSLFKSDKRIGELNGRWAALFKFVLLMLFLIIPVIGSWGVWITKQVMASQFHAQQTEGYEQRISTLEKFCERNTVSTVQIDNRISKLENISEVQSEKFDIFKQNNATEHGQILVLLESMKVTLDILKHKE